MSTNRLAILDGTCQSARIGSTLTNPPEGKQSDLFFEVKNQGAFKRVLDVGIDLSQGFESYSIKFPPVKGSLGQNAQLWIPTIDPNDDTEFYIRIDGPRSALNVSLNDTSQILVTPGSVELGNATKLSVREGLFMPHKTAPVAGDCTINDALCFTCQVPATQQQVTILSNKILSANDVVLAQCTENDPTFAVKCVLVAPGSVTIVGLAPATNQTSLIVQIVNTFPA